MIRKVKLIDKGPLFRARVRNDYDPVVEAILDGAWFIVQTGYIEGDPLAEKYSDLVCPWCGKLHYRDECQKELRKMNRKYAHI